eukprot:TRINITY_DN26480_c0_g1_i4.p1 TRINITY_DN26480_c0_g1~~TRINITY_DN26480_c0_g1_i4.p1  ORF type:complete len:746 (-),score=284.91 TRINITY_DN26480_c0_g1_i4:71-2308(-)
MAVGGSAPSSVGGHVSTPSVRRADPKALDDERMDPQVADAIRRGELEKVDLTMPTRGPSEVSAEDKAAAEAKTQAIVEGKTPALTLDAAIAAATKKAQEQNLSPLEQASSVAKVAIDMKASEAFTDKVAVDTAREAGRRLSLPLAEIIDLAGKAAEVAAEMLQKSPAATGAAVAEAVKQAGGVPKLVIKKAALGAKATAVRQGDAATQCVQEAANAAKAAAARLEEEPSRGAEYVAAAMKEVGSETRLAAKTAAEAAHELAQQHALSKASLVKAVAEAAGEVMTNGRLPPHDVAEAVFEDVLAAGGSLDEGEHAAVDAAISSGKAEGMQRMEIGVEAAEAAKVLSEKAGDGPIGVARKVAAAARAAGQKLAVITDEAAQAAQEAALKEAKPSEAAAEAAGMGARVAAEEGEQSPEMVAKAALKADREAGGTFSDAVKLATNIVAAGAKKEGKGLGAVAKDVAKVVEEEAESDKLSPEGAGEAVAAALKSVGVPHPQLVEVACDAAKNAAKDGGMTHAEAVLAAGKCAEKLAATEPANDVAQEVAVAMFRAGGKTKELTKAASEAAARAARKEGKAQGEVVKAIAEAAKTAVAVTQDPRPDTAGRVVGNAVKGAGGTDTATAAAAGKAAADVATDDGDSSQLAAREAAKAAAEVARKARASPHNTGLAAGDAALAAGGDKHTVMACASRAAEEAAQEAGESGFQVHDEAAKASNIYLHKEAVTPPAVAGAASSTGYTPRRRASRSL